MSRPANANAQETRDRILKTATALFAQHGHDGTSLRDVAGKAKVNAAMVSHYFGSKQELYEECVREIFGELSEMQALLRGELARGLSLGELVERSVRTCFRFACTHRTAVRLLIREAVTTGKVSAIGRDMLLETLSMASALMSERLGRDAKDVRLSLQSIVFLIARYAAQDVAELEAVADRVGEKATHAVEDHLVVLAHGLLGTTKNNASTKGNRSAK